MPPTLTAQAAVLATAMAVSGTLILLALRLSKSFPLPSSSPPPRSSISSGIMSADRRKKRTKKKEKRVHFAEDVVEPSGKGEEYRRRLHSNKCYQRRNSNSTSDSDSWDALECSTVGKGDVGVMAANRVALYNGILRDRVLHRLPSPC